MAMFSDQISRFRKKKIQMWSVAQCFGMELHKKLGFTVILDFLKFLEEKLPKQKHIATISDQISGFREN